MPSETEAALLPFRMQTSVSIERPSSGKTFPEQIAFRPQVKRKGAERTHDK